MRGVASLSFLLFSSLQTRIWSSKFFPLWRMPPRLKFEKFDDLLVVAPSSHLLSVRQPPLFTFVMLIFGFVATLSFASPLSSAILGGPSETPRLAGMSHLAETPHFSETPNFDETPHLVESPHFDDLPHVTLCHLLLGYQPLEKPHVHLFCFLHETSSPLVTFHLETVLPW